jgi:hypothetical protein
LALGLRSGTIACRKADHVAGSGDDCSAVSAGLAQVEFSALPTLKPQTMEARNRSLRRVLGRGLVVVLKKKNPPKKKKKKKKKTKKKNDKRKMKKKKKKKKATQKMQRTASSFGLKPYVCWGFPRFPLVYFVMRRSGVRVT